MEKECGGIREKNGKGKKIRIESKDKDGGKKEHSTMVNTWESIYLAMQQRAKTIWWSGGSGMLFGQNIIHLECNLICQEYCK